MIKDEYDPVAQEMVHKKYVAGGIGLEDARVVSFEGFSGEVKGAGDMSMIATDLEIMTPNGKLVWNEENSDFAMTAKSNDAEEVAAKSQESERKLRMTSTVLDLYGATFLAHVEGRDNIAQKDLFDRFSLALYKLGLQPDPQSIKSRMESISTKKYMSFEDYQFVLHAIRTGVAEEAFVRKILDISEQFTGAIFRAAVESGVLKDNEYIHGKLIEFRGDDLWSSYKGGTSSRDSWMINEAINRGIIRDEMSFEIIWKSVMKYEFGGDLQRFLATALEKDILPQSVKKLKIIKVDSIWKKIVIETIDKGLENGYWPETIDLLTVAYKKRWIDKKQLNDYVERIKGKSIKSAYLLLFIKFQGSDELSEIGATFDDYKNALGQLKADNEQSWSSYFVDGVRRKIINDRDLVQKILTNFQEKKNWILYFRLAIAAREAGIFTDEKEINVGLNQLKEAGEWQQFFLGYMDAIQKKYVDFDGEIIKRILDGAETQRVPRAFAVSVEHYSNKYNLSEAKKEELYRLGKEALEKIEDINQQAERKDQKIDINFLRENLLPAISRLHVISERLLKSILDQYLDQRAYLPLLVNVFELVLSLQDDDIDALRDFYRENKGYDVSRAGFNPADFYVSIAGYVQAYLTLGATRQEFREDFRMSLEKRENVLTYLGKKILLKIAKKLNIIISEDSLNVGYRDILREWDLRYLGLLLSTSQRWGGDESQLFNLLLSSALEGTIDGLVYPPAYGRYSLEVYGGGFEDLVRRIRLHNLNQLREMETFGVNVNAWINANETVSPRSTVGEGVQRPPVEIIRAFATKFEEFKVWARQNSTDTDIVKLTQKMGAWGRINPDNIKATLMKDRSSLRSLGNSLNTLADKFTDQSAEPLFDFQRALQEVLDYDESRASASGLWLWFGERVPGRESFAGNCAGSCTSLDKNASAVFEFQLDQGTKYLFIGEEAHGKIRGYLRIWVGLDSANKPILFVDSIDGSEAYQFENQMRDHLAEFANKIGISSDKIVWDRSGDVAQKIGDSLTAKYFHHSDLTVNLSVIEDYENEGLLSWVPRGGWVDRRKNSTEVLDDKVLAEKADEAMVSDNNEVGGIDMDSKWLDLESKGTKDDFELVPIPEALRSIQVQGFSPIIIQISPIKNLQPFLELGEKDVSQDSQISLK